jgi:diguanylate cyclase
VPTPAKSALLDARKQLRLEAALQLLEHAGETMPAEDLRSGDWLQSLIDRLCDLSSRDPLTGLANRRTLELALDREIDRVARAGEPAMVLALDIDHFKRVNDVHGHAAGDLVLKAVAQVLLDTVRPMDTVARVGGEEFAIIMPNCPPTYGHTVAERLLRRVEQATVAVATQQTVRVTLSIGGAFAPQWVRSSAALWLERADQQLYRAKDSGRNCVCLQQPPMSHVSAEEKTMLFGTSQLQELE